MKQDIINKEFRGNQEYVSPSMKVIEVAVQRVICGSTDIDDNGIDGFTLKDPDTGTWK